VAREGGAASVIWIVRIVDYEPLVAKRWCQTLVEAAWRPTRVSLCAWVLLRRALDAVPLPNAPV